MRIYSRKFSFYLRVVDCVLVALKNSRYVTLDLCSLDFSGLANKCLRFDSSFLETWSPRSWVSIINVNSKFIQCDFMRHLNRARTCYTLYGLHNIHVISTSVLSLIIITPNNILCKNQRNVQWLLADRTNGRTYATVLCPSVVCNLRIVAKRCVLPKYCLKKQ